MMGVSELSANQSGLLSEHIDTAVATLSQSRALLLTKYTKYTNPADGYRYWLKSADTRSIRGSLHNAATQEQSQDETVSHNRIVLTTEDAIKGFDEIDPSSAWFIEIVADDPALVDGGPLFIGFNIADNFYEQAGAYHYIGYALYPQFRSFVISDPETFLATIQPANCLPILLGMATYLGIPMYAAYAVPANIRGAYISIDIQGSRSLQAIPTYSETGTNPVTGVVDQFKRDEVELVCYNLDQSAAQKVLWMLGVYLPDRLAQYGLANSLSMVDQDRVQSEYNLRANKKSVRMSINYWLSTSQSQLLKTINEANYSLEVTDVSLD